MATGERAGEVNAATFVEVGDRALLVGFGDVPDDAMIPAGQAVGLVMRVLTSKLSNLNANSLDLCVTHDMTVFTMRHGMGLEPVTGPDVEFLDGLILFEKDGRQLMASHHGGVVDVAESLGRLGA